MIDHVDEVAARLRAVVVGRPDGAKPLYAAWTAGEITVAGLRDLLPDAWAYSDPSPETVIGALAWVVMFRATGLLLRPTNHPALDNPLTIYRGALPDRRGGMAWTTQQTKAEQFRVRRERAERVPAFVFRATVQLDAVLGAFNTRGEYEIVVDPAFLDHIDQLD